GFPNGPRVGGGGVVVLGRVVGIAVTVVAALVPALKASRVPPVAAMRDVAIDTSATSRGRIITGSVILALGLASAINGVAGKKAGPIGLGAVLTLVGMVMLGPVIAGPVSRLIRSTAHSFRGMTANQARHNAVHSPI